MRRDSSRDGGGMEAPERRAVRRPLYPTLQTTQAPLVAQQEPEYVQPFSYQTPAYNAPRGAGYNIPKAPAFYAPAFMIPRAEAVFNDPSYQFRLNQGLDAIERSAAARGMLRTGNTLQDLMRYGQDYASQEYGNMFNRAAQAYGTNYQGLRDMYAPNLAYWQAVTQQGTGNENLRQQQSFDAYRMALDDEFRREQMLMNFGAPR